MTWHGLFYPASSEEDARARATSWFLITFFYVLAITTLAAGWLTFSALLPPAARGHLSFAKALGFMGFTMLVGAAAYAAGGLLGFLFGIPRVKTAEAPAAAGDGGSTVESN